MKRKKISKSTDNRPSIKVRLDSKTILILKSMDAFKVWLAKFPEAKIIA